MPRYNSGDIVPRSSRTLTSRPYPPRHLPLTRRPSPFTRLSNDVLLNLIECGLPEKDNENRLFYLFNLGTVSQSLRRVLLSNTKLWRHIFVPNMGNNAKGLRYENWLAMALERSGTQLLSITVDFKHTPTQRFQRAWEVIQTHYLHRCARLCIISDDLDDEHDERMAGLHEAPLETWNPWWRLPPRMSNAYEHSIDEEEESGWWWVLFPLPAMPSLVEIEVTQGEEMSVPLDIFSSPPPKLRAVHINGMFHDSWLDTFSPSPSPSFSHSLSSRSSSASCSGLTALHISPRSQPLLIAQLLSRLPALERLYIDQDGLDDRYSGATHLYPLDYPSSSPDIFLNVHPQLPRLRDLRLNGESACLVASVIRAPRLRSLEVSGCGKARCSPRALSQLLRAASGLGQGAGGMYPDLELFALRRGWDYRSPHPSPIPGRGGGTGTIAEDLANFFTTHTGLKVVILDKSTALPALFAHLYSGRAFRNWKLLHIHLNPMSIPLPYPQYPLPDLKPLLTFNKDVKVHFSDEILSSTLSNSPFPLSTLSPLSISSPAPVSSDPITWPWSSDILSYCRAYPNNVRLQRYELWDEQHFATMDWYQSLMDEWDWAWVGRCLKMAGAGR